MTTIRSGLTRGLRRAVTSPLTALTVAGVLVVTLVTWGFVALASGPQTYRVSAMFSSAPGIYPGNAVKVLGVKVGSVQGVTPDAEGVKVDMAIEASTRIPEGVKAYLMAPNVVNDRFIELDPGYTGGSALPAGTTVPMDRTVVPQSVDQIVASIDRLATDLGPGGANEDGSLSRLLRTIATTFGGDGSTINSAVRNLGDTFAAVSANTDDLTGLLNDLGSVTHAASGVSGQYEALAGDLAEVSSTLSGDDGAIASSIANLSDVLRELNTFVKRNKSQLAGTLNSLSQVAATVGDQQKTFSEALHLLPLAVDNTGRTIAGGSIRTRVDQASGSRLQSQVCGDGMLRMLLLTLSPQTDTHQVMSLACGTNELLQSFQPGAGAPDASGLSLTALQSTGGQ